MAKKINHRAIARIVQAIAVGADAVPMPAIPAMGSVWQYWGVTEANIISGKQKPAAGWQKMIADIQSKIKK